MGTPPADRHSTESAIEQSIKVLDGLSIEDYVKQERWNRSVVFDSKVAGKQITASYAIAGSQDPNAMTFLYVGGLFGGRLHGLYVDYYLAKNGVRGIFVDRPGLGRFTPTGIENRIAVWYEAVPLILKDVGVERVALVALSGGAPYVFNLAWERPDLVDPDAPLFTLSPWVHPSKSQVRMHSWMAWIPASMTRGISKVATMAVQRLLTVAQSGEQAKRKLSWVGNESKVLETCGAPAVEINAHRGYFAKTIFDEDSSGSVEDYILGVKDPKSTWGVAADYEQFAKLISERYEKQGKTLRIQAFFAENDVFIGNKGIQFFHDTFGNSELQPGVEFIGEVMPDTAHESIAFPENGAIGKMIELASRHGTTAR